MTPSVLGVDLASKYSAWLMRSATGEVHSQGDSQGLSAFEMVNLLARVARDQEPDLIVVEDVPYGIAGQFQTKPVTRLQGMLMHALGPGLLTRTFFLNPSTWQRHYPGVARGKPQDRIEAARVAALERGYEPPNLVQEYIDSLPEGSKILKKNTNPLAKVMTDYVDAWLITEFVQQTPDFFSISGVQAPNI